MRDEVPMPNLNITIGNAIISKNINIVTDMRRYNMATKNLEKPFDLFLDELHFSVHTVIKIKLNGVNGLGKNNNFLISRQRALGKETDHFPYDLIKTNSLENNRIAESYR